MEFWGVEVKAGETFKVKFEDDKILHLSQATLGESKKEKGSESIPLFLKIDQQKLVLGTLATSTIPQLSFDLVFDKEFELSHSWKNGSVYFMGYKSILPDGTEEEYSDFGSDSEEDVKFLENGKSEPKVEQEKAVPTNANAAKAKAKVEELPKDAKDEDDNDDDDDSDEDMDDDDDSEDESDEDMSDAEDGSDEESESDDEETPKKAELGKKRPTESATKTPVPAKKAKVVTPQKTDGKKGGPHTATPHPNKKVAKTPASIEKGKGQTPKSGGQVSCKSCSKSFNSENALQSHTKAKHSAA